MADKSTKTTKPKARKGKAEPSVLASLPSTRAARIGGRRGAPAALTPAPAAKPKPATKAKAKASAGPKAKAPARSKPKAGAAAPPKAAPTRKPTRPEPVLTSVGADTTPEPGPRPVRPAAPSLGTSGERPAPDERTGPPSGTELVTTAIQAAGELATIGVKVSGHILKRAVDRLPKP